MNSAAKLTLAFLEQAPRPAAQVLQSLSVDQAGAYLESVPARLAGPALAAMTAWHAARVLEGVPASRAALLLRQLVFSDATSVVRLMRPELRTRMLAELPTQYAHRLGRSLQYPPHQVGAWIDPGVPMLSESSTVDDALRALRAGEPSSHVFLEADDHGRYAGAVSVQQVLRSEATITLGQLRSARGRPLASLASLASVISDARWDDMLHLPVVDRRGHLLGGLSRHALRKGIHDHRAETRAQRRSLVVDVGAALAFTCASLGRMLADSRRVGIGESSGDTT